MNATQRVTISLPADILKQARAASQGNLSQFVASALREHFAQERRLKLRESLIAGAIAHAEEDLATAEAFRYAEDEAVALYVLPHEPEHADAYDALVVAEQ